MKNSLKVLSLVVGAVALMAGGAVRAESTYGYSSAGAAAALTATAKLNVTVTVPKLILLRVGGDDTTVSTAAIAATLSGGIPGGVAAPINGNRELSGWSGDAPTWNGGSSGSIRAFAWTNAAGGGTVTPAITTAFSDAGLAAKISVASQVYSGAGLTHPATLNLTTAMSFAKHVVAASDWTFSITAADVATTDAGVNSAQMTYTATTL